MFKYSVGPWNVHSGADAYGPATRDEIPFEEKIKKFKDMGFDAIQFHDDDAVPNMNEFSEAEIIEEAKKVNPDFQEFKDAKGLKEKARVVVSHIERDGLKIAEENRENYKKMLEEQRENMNNTINGNK